MTRTDAEALTELVLPSSSNHVLIKTALARVDRAGNAILDSEVRACLKFLRFALLAMDPAVWEFTRDHHPEMWNDSTFNSLRNQYAALNEFASGEASAAGPEGL